MAGKAIGKAKIEKDTRTRLLHLLGGDGLMRGTLIFREKRCGKDTCKCARGEKHTALYLLSSKDGHVRQTFVPRAKEAEVRGWIEQYKLVEELLEDLSDICWEKIKSKRS